jgi:lysyl-tRNA synthetase, class I
MHWAVRIAENLARRHPDRKIFNFASGITPSGPVHVGNLRDIVTNWAVARCLRERGREVRLLHSWDDFDRFRKIPKQVPDAYQEFLGRPLIRIPDPFGCHASYARHFEEEFERSLHELGIECNFRYQGELYSSGVYNTRIIKAVECRREIFDIIDSYRTKPNPELRDQYLPIEVYCTFCNRDTTRITFFSEHNFCFSYECSSCGFIEELCLRNATNIKLPWKVDWAMRWDYEDVVFEPGGKDHGTAGGSFEVSSKISRAVFSRTPPMFQMYEFIGLKGVAGKMSSSTGELITPADALKVYQPEVLLWIFMRFPPTKAFDLVLDKQILQIYDDFDKAYRKACAHPDDPDSLTINISLLPNRNIHTVPFNQLVSFVDIVGGNDRALTEIFARLGSPYTVAELSERLEKAKYWLEHYAPQERILLLSDLNIAYLNTLIATEINWVKRLQEQLSVSALSSKEIAELLYSIPTEENGSPDPTVQKRFFEIIYNLLFGKSIGPRLATFLAAVPKEQYLSLLTTHLA